MTALRSSLEAVDASAKALRFEKERLGEEIRELEAELQSAVEAQLIAQRAQTNAENFSNQARSFVVEHEGPVEQQRRLVEEHHRLFSATVLQLQQLDEAEPGLKEALQGARKSAEDIRALARDAKKAIGELAGEYIGNYRSIEPPRTIELLVAQFSTGVASYEGKIQKGPLDGEIKVLQSRAAEIAAQYERARDSLSAALIEEAAREEAIDVAVERQERTVAEALEQQTLATSEFQKAQKDAPRDPEFKAGEDLDPERLPQPETATECLQIAESYRAEAESLKQNMESARTHQFATRDEASKVRERIPRYDEWQKQLAAWRNGASAHPAFSGLIEQDGKLVRDSLAKNRSIREELTKVDNRIGKRLEDHLFPHIQAPAFDMYRIPFRDRLKLLRRDDFLAKVDEQIESVTAQMRVCEDELASEEQERRIIVEKLDAIARRAANLLAQAENVSTMPDALGPWAGQSFLRIAVPRKNDPSERQVLLRQAVERWFQAGSIPTGHKLAYECLLALCGTKSVSIRILKPEYHLSALPRDITELVKFSDGEKLTTAILLYCILVRLRARQKARAEHLLTKDSGMLLLDNPFGKATLAEFVDLQLRMARMMGVQLIYATGINDFAALKEFPHYVRLRNSSRGQGSNDYYVTPDSRALEGDQQVEGVAFGRTQKTAADNGVRGSTF